MYFKSLKLCFLVLMLNVQLGYSVCSSMNGFRGRFISRAHQKNIFHHIRSCKLSEKLPVSDMMKGPRRMCSDSSKYMNNNLHQYLPYFDQFYDSTDQFYFMRLSVISDIHIEQKELTELKKEILSWSTSPIWSKALSVYIDDQVHQMNNIQDRITQHMSRVDTLLIKNQKRLSEVNYNMHVNYLKDILDSLLYVQKVYLKWFQDFITETVNVSDSMDSDTLMTKALTEKIEHLNTEACNYVHDYQYAYRVGCFWEVAEENWTEVQSFIHKLRAMDK